MKKFLVSILAFAVIGGAFAQSSFPDVPENHWAGGAVDRIADLGIVIGFPDGTFRGNEAFTRYQAALVVSRLLDVIGQELDARQALTDADLAALANALQDLADEVLGQGERLANAEDAIAAIADGVVVNSARLDALENLIGSGDSAAIQDLLNQLAAQRVALDTALAQAASAEQLAQNAMSVARAAANRAAANEDAINSLAWLINDHEGRISALEGRPVGDLSIADRMTRAESDIANIREFVILLRRDQVALRNQVAGIAEQTDANTADIADLQDRVAALEENMISFSGSINFSYRVDRLSGAGNQFDVDRAFGFGLPRQMGTGSTFTSGTLTANQEADPDLRVQEHYADIGLRFRSPVSAALTLNVTFNRVFDGQGSPNALNDFESIVDVYLRPADLTRGTTSFTGYVFGVRNFTGTVGGIGEGSPIVFTFGEEVSTAFTPYVFRRVDQPGFVASVANPLPFLDFLNPGLQVAYFARTDSAGVDTHDRAARLTLSPLDSVTIGASFAQSAVSTNDREDLASDNFTTTVWGVDATAAISIFSLNAEFATASQHDAVTDVTTSFDPLYYVELGVDTENIPVLNSISANYRNIPAAWDHRVDNPGLVNNMNAYPFQVDQNGFGVDASLSLWIVDLTAYFNSYTTSVQSASSTDAASITAFGVDVAAEIFRAVSVTAFFHSASVDGALVDSTRFPYLESDAAATAGATRVDRDGSLATGFGVGLAHDGAADNALVPNLNLSAGFRMMEADFGRTIIEADADYSLSLGFLTATPYVGFSMASSQNNASRPNSPFNVTRIAAGTSLETEAFDFFLRPSLVGAVNWRSSAYTDVQGGAAPDYTATEFQFSVGVALNEFLFDNSVLTVRYASWAGTNVATTIRPHSGGGRGNSASLIHTGDVNNGIDQYVNGFEGIWNFHDLEFAYGVYQSAEGAGPSETVGQVFRIRYTVNF